MTLAATLLLSVIPQVFPGGDLKLPPKTPAQEQPVDVRPLSELERFERDLLEMQGPQIKVDAKLDEMGQAYPKIEQLILEVARKARSTEMVHLMPVARRFGRISGTGRVSDELLFQLLGRRLGKATRPVIEAMVELKGDGAREALRQCLRARIPAVRRQAVMVYADIAGVEDIEFAMQLSREQSLDLQLRGLDLLQAIGTPEAIDRMIELLSKKPSLAAAACEALVRVGEPAAGLLNQRLQQPAVDRSFVYAAFALAQIGAQTDRDLLADELFEPLKKRLQAPEPLTRCLAAVPLADLCYRGVDAAGGDYPDRELVDALLLVVEPRSFVPNLDLLRAPSEERLLRHTGRVLVASEPLPWHKWWEAQKDTFLGVRAKLHVDDANVASAIVTLRQRDRIVRVLGENMADLAPRDDAVEVLLSRDEMLTFVRGLEQEGFGNPVAMHVDSALPRVRSIELQIPGGRTSVAVTDREHFAFDNLAGLTERVVDEQLWQLYRIPQDEPDRAAFWRSERRWRDSNEDPIARARRFAKRLASGWQHWGREARARGVAALLANPDRKQVLTEEVGELALASLEQRGKDVDDVDLQLLEIAASVPGDKVWRRCVEFAVTVDQGSTKAVRGVFQVLGADAVLSALADENAVVRRAAIDEVVRVRDQRAAPRLIAMIGDEDHAVRRGAVFACGHLRVRAASEPLVERITDPETPADLFRDCLVALGRCGGELAFPYLQRAITLPNEEDKQAALRGLGELRDPRAAHLLAEFVVIGKDQPIGELAKYHLQRLGAQLAVPALRGQLPVVRDEETRAELVLMLGLYQDPRVAPDLMDLLRQPDHAREATALLEGTTGADLTNVKDRITAMETWWSKNKNGAQWQWLLAALQELEIPTTLDADQFVTGVEVGAVPELSRLLEELTVPRLWVLTSAVLREATGEDFGAVTQQTPPQIRAGIAARYRVHAEGARAAKKQ